MRSSMKWVQLGLLSTPTHVQKYIVVGTASTGKTLFRNMISNNPLEGYHQSFYHNIPIQALAAGFDYHMLRADLFDWAWNVHVAFRAGHLPDVGHTWIWLGDGLLEALRAWPIEDLPLTLQRWRKTDTTIEPVMRRGLMKELLLPITEHMKERVTSLGRPEERELVLRKCPEFVVTGDVNGVYRETNIVTTKAALLQLSARVQSRMSIQNVLDQRNFGELVPPPYISQSIDTTHWHRAHVHTRTGDLKARLQGTDGGRSLVAMPRAVPAQVDRSIHGVPLPLTLGNGVAPGTIGNMELVEDRGGADGGEATDAAAETKSRRQKGRTAKRKELQEKGGDAAVEADKKAESEKRKERRHKAARAKEVAADSATAAATAATATAAAAVPAAAAETCGMDEDRALSGDEMEGVR